MNTTKILQENGFKVTKARIGVIEFLAQDKGPATVEEVTAYLQQQGVAADMATVYRILKKLTEKKLLNVLEFQENKARYELATLPHHHHLICENCGKIIGFKDADLEEAISKVEQKTGFIVNSHRLDFFGICQDCQLKGNP